MELTSENLRFTNARIKKCLEKEGLDLRNLTGEQITSTETLSTILSYGLPEGTGHEVQSMADEMTPGEIYDLVSVALYRDMVGKSIREAQAKAATDTKSQQVPTP